MSGKIIVDEIEKSAEGTGVKLNSPLLNSSGTEIMSAAGALSGNVTFPSTIDNTTLGSNVTFPSTINTTKLILGSGIDFGTHNGKAYTWALNQNTMVQGSGASRQYDILLSGQAYSTYQGWSSSSTPAYDAYGNAGGISTEPSVDDWIDFSNNRISLKNNGNHGKYYLFTGYSNWYSYAWTSNGKVTVQDENGTTFYSYSGGTGTAQNISYCGVFSFIVNFDDVGSVRFFNNYTYGTYSSISGGRLEIRRLA